MINIGKENFIKNFTNFPKKNFLIVLFLLGFGEWFISDVIDFSGGSIGFFILCFVGYFYLRNDAPKFREPKDLKGWINLCNEDLDFFNELEEKNNFEKKNNVRQDMLFKILKDFKKPRILFLNHANKNLHKIFSQKYFSENKCRPERN